MVSLPSVRATSQATIGVRHRWSAQRLITSNACKIVTASRFTVNYGFTIPPILSVANLRIDAPAQTANRLLCGRFASILLHNVYVPVTA